MMELLSPQQVDQALFSLEKYNEARAEVEDEVNSFEYLGVNSEEMNIIKQNILRKDSAASRVKFRMAPADQYHTAEQHANNVFESLSPNGKSAWEKLSDIIFYLHRREIDYAIRWPINYMDVFPFSFEDYRDISKTLCTRDTLCIKNRINLITSPHVCQKESKIIPFKFVNKRRIINNLKKFVQEIVQDIVYDYAHNTTSTPKLTFIFTGDRVIKPKNVDGIHVFDLMYKYLDWNTNDTTPTTTRVINQIKYLNYKIAKWITYDVLHGVINNTMCDLTIYLADDYLSSLSYFFTRLGSSLCTREVYFEFPAPIEEAAEEPYMLIGQPSQNRIPIADIISAQAYYFKWNHEIYRTNVDVVGFDPPQLMKDSCHVSPELTLYSQMNALREAVFANVIEGELGYPEIPTPSTPGHDYKFIFAAPGTGKSTYMKANCNNSFNIDLDSLLAYLTINGTTIAEHMERHMASVDYSNIPYERLGVILQRTHKIELHGAYLVAYIRIAEAWRDRLRASLIGQVNICDEDIAGTFYTYVPIFNPNFTPCGNIPNMAVRCDYIDKLIADKVLTKIVVIRIEPTKQYAQMLSRSLVEDRVIRFYTLLQFNRAMMSGIPKRWRDYVEIYRATDSRQLEKITGTPTEIEFLRARDPPFGEFVANHYS